MSLRIKLGNFLFNHAYFLYKPLYHVFKHRQDAFEIRLLQQHIAPGAMVLDIGANIGFYSTLFSRLAGPFGQVHCFEPDRLNFARLQRNTAGLQNVHLHNAAVGASSGKLTLYVSDQLNVDHRTYQPETCAAQYEVAALGLDEYVRTGGLPGLTVDFIKMDIQGFEVQALKGMAQLLANNPEVKMLAELWPYGLRLAGSSVSEYLGFLADLGFSCYLLNNNALQPLDPAAAANMQAMGKDHYCNIFVSRKTPALLV